MQIADLIPATEVEGPGVRCAIWLQGCPIRCQNCCNPQFFDAQKGSYWSPQDLAQKIMAFPVEGVTILGGEPLAQAEELLQMLTLIRQNSELNIWLFTGYVWEDIQLNSQFKAVVDCCDMVIAGPFDQHQTPDSRRWIGSRNQTTHAISARSNEMIQNWPDNREEIEFHIRANGEILLNGSPMKSGII